MADEAIAELKVENEDLPALFQAADHASLEAQRRYLLLMKTDLTMLVIGALFASFSLPDPLLTRLLSVIGALLLGTGLILTLVLTQKGFRNDWFSGRAIAESTKTIAWRYMSRAEPFEQSLEPQEADRLFLERLQSILQQNEHLTVTQAEVSGHGRQITDTMELVRKADPEQRKAIYLKDRIENQLHWYSEKSTTNHKGEKRLFLRVIVAQALALLTAILVALFPAGMWNPTGMLSALAAAVLAWLQVKQHQELAQSYGLVAHELSLIAEQARHITDEKSFSKFVGDAENAISREHTLWLARRDRIAHQ